MIMDSSTKKVIIAFLLGLVLMFVLDMIFHFNNSVETEMQRQSKKAKKQIENIFK